MKTPAKLSLGQLMSDVVSALSKPSLPLARRRAIASIMLLHECSFDVASDAFQRAVELEETLGGGEPNLEDPCVLRSCANQASAWAVRVRPRLRLVQGAP